MNRQRTLVMGLLLIVLALAFGALPTHAATITVNTTNDSGTGSLRQAIANAVSGDTINFALTYPATITLTSGRISIIGKNLTISGPGASNLTISGNNQNVFNFDYGLTTTISDVTIVKGGNSSTGYGVYDNGGTLTLNNCVFSGNKNGVWGGGTLTVTNCVFTDNTYNGINFAGTLNVTDSNFSGNNAGAIYRSSGAATVTGSTFSNNRSTVYAGAIENSQGTLTVTNCTFSGNNAVVGSAINNAGTVVNVTNSTFSSNTAGDRGTINNTGTLTVANSTFTSNSAPWGNIHNDGTATVINSTFTSNSATGGGGILNDTGTLTVTGSTFSRNTGPTDESYGGGIDNTSTATVINSTFTGNYAVAGGGIGNWGTLTVINSTFSGNSAGSGGGIYTETSEGWIAMLKNTIVASSTAGGNCYGTPAATSTNNLSTDSTCTTGFTQVTPAQLALGALTGTPAYYPLDLGSVAIDTGTNTGCPATDQRGVSRPQDGDGNGTAICDIGSYEFVYLPMNNKLYLPLILR